MTLEEAALYWFSQAAYECCEWWSELFSRNKEWLSQHSCDYPDPPPLVHVWNPSISVTSVQQQRSRRPVGHCSLDVAVASSQVAVTTQSLGQRKLPPKTPTCQSSRRPRNDATWGSLNALLPQVSTDERFQLFFFPSVQFAQRVWDQAGRHRSCGWLMVDDAIRRGCGWETTRALQTPRQLQLCHP